MALRMCLRTLYAALALSLWGQMSFAQDHVINLKDADIRAFIEDTSVVTGKTFIVDPRVTGTVSVSSQAKLSKAEVFQVFLDVLRVRGFTAVPTSAGAYRITLVQGAAQDAPFTSGRGRQGTMSTAIIKLAHGDAAQAAKLIKPVLHSQGRLAASNGGRVMVITDYPENLVKARQIIAAMDVDQAAVETIKLTHISAREAKDAVTELMGNGRPQVRNNIVVGETVRVVAVESSNMLILRGDPADVAQMKSIVQSLDTAGSLPRGSVSVVALRYADGEDVVKILKEILPAYDTEAKTGPKPSVAHEPGSNSLIISAQPDVQKALEDVVRRLDVRRAQVLVEAIIVEISDTAAQDLGVQFLLAGNDNSALPFISTNYSRSAPNLLAITGALAGDNLGASSRTGLEDAAVTSLLGLQGGTIGIGGNGRNGLFGAILNAVQNDTDSNVLSTPFVTTLDNVPATFLVGQEVPFTSGETLGTNNSNPFRTINRQEIGIKLEVVPHINEGDVVRLEIRQEVSSIAPDASVIATDLVTNKREISTTVLADDGEIIVLGGLIQDDEQLFRSKVPILGDIPGIGNLFRSHNNSRKRTNLMVFIRPSILRSSEDAAPVTAHKLNLMRRQDMLKNGEGSTRIDDALDQLSPRSVKSGTQ
jgi:general secretion pathway protein D